MLLVDAAAAVRRPVGVVRVTGADRLTYLHSLLSQHLENAAPGTVADFLYLDAKGNALAAGRAVVRADDVLLVVPPEVAASLADALARFTFLLDAAAIDDSSNWALASVRGAGGASPPEEQDGLVLPDRSGGFDLLGSPQWVDERVAALGLPSASLEEWEAWRISAGVPGWGTEITPGRRAQELGLLPTHVHLRKGCYPGQESIAKVYNLGRPRRALAVIDADGPIAAGEPVEALGKTGEVTSAAAIGDRWFALALVPLTRDGKTPDEVSIGAHQGRVRRRVAEGLEQPGADDAGAAKAGRR